MTADAPDRDDWILAGEYALGLLPADEAAAFEARLADEPGLAAKYAVWVEDLARLADEVSPVAPPASVLAAAEARLFGKAAPQNRVQRLVYGWFAGAAAVVAVAAIIMVATGVLDRGPQAPADPAYRADIAAEDRSLVVAAAYSADEGALFVEREAGGALPGRALELWLIEGDNPPVSLGVLPEETRAVLNIPEELRNRLAGGVLAISDEPPGGSPTGAPTGAVLAVGPVTDA